MTKLRAGVVGAGVFGGFHANKYAEIDAVEFQGVFDRDDERAAAVADKTGARAFESFDALLDAVDIVTIASPAATHFEAALTALKAGKDVLVEKPIALSLPDADALIAAADEGGRILQVGHQERYVADAFGLLDIAVPPREIHCRRAGPFSGRATDVSVVMDLMIHDLDLARVICRSQVETVAATARSKKSSHADEVKAELILAGGAKATFLASRIAEERQRDMRLVYDEGEILIDFVNRTIENSTPFEAVRDFETVAETAAFKDPLHYGVAAFVDSAANRSEPPVTATAGRAALDWALQIESAAS